MLQILRKWFNGKKEYFTGVSLYSQIQGHDHHLLELMKKGPTEFTRKKLGDELVAHYALLQAQEGAKIQGSVIGVRAVKMKSSANSANGNGQLVENSEIKNPELYRVCKEKADRLYKEVMNQRAELFALARPDEYTDLN